MNNLAHKLISLFSASGSWLLKKYKQRSQSKVTTLKKNWGENNDKKEKFSSETIIYLNAKWVIGLSIDNKETIRSGLSEKTHFRFMQVFENVWTISS